MPILLSDKPHFVGEVIAKWLKDGREMELTQDFSFIDEHGVKWDAPKGSIVDGASIPRFFWRYIGSPFVGKYRRASVIHDVYCKTKSRPSDEVHQVFYDMMLVSGVSKAKALKMYMAVKAGGPSW